MQFKIWKLCWRNNGTSSPYSIGISHGMSYFFARAQCNDKCFSLLHNSISFLLPQNLLQCFPRLLLSIADIQMLEIWILKLIHSNLVLYFKTGYKVTHNSSITLESSHISGKTAWNRNFSIVTLNRCCRIWYDSGSGSFITIHHSTISSKRVFNRGRLSFFFHFPTAWILWKDIHTCKCILFRLRNTAPFFLTLKANTFFSPLK